MDDTARWAALAAAEGREHVAAATAGLHALERAGAERDAAGGREALDAVFRAVHSLKGMGAAMGYVAVVRVAHAVEELLAGLRTRSDGEVGLLVHAELPIESLLAGVDALHDTVEQSVGGGPGLPDAAVDALVARLADAAGDGSPPATTTASRAAPASPCGLPVALAGTVRVQVRLVPDAPLPGARAVVALRRARALGAVSDVVPPEDGWGDPAFEGTFAFTLAAAADDAEIARTVRLAGDVAEVRVVRAARGPSMPAAAANDPAQAAWGADAAGGGSGSAVHAGGRQVRLDAARLDVLLDLVGELGVARGRLAAAAARSGDRALAAAVGEVARVTAALQAEVLESRLVPLAEVFDRMPRVVRDAARATGKGVTLAVGGADVAIDRGLLDGLAEPLGHLLRNAVDHGIEPADARERAGKPAVGRVRLHARRERDAVVIEVGDDGGGVDVAAVMRRAGERGLLAPAAAPPAGRADTPGGDGAELLRLVAAPGLSTARAVNAVSGRGVGLDAALTRVRALGGSLALRSAPGAGTTFTVRLPVTLAVMQVLLVREGDLTCAVPVSHVRETLDAPPDARSTTTGWDGGPEPRARHLVRTRGALVPLLTLHAVVAGGGAADASHARPDPAPHGPVPGAVGEVVVVEAAGAVMALSVDAVLAQTELVVKPMPRLRGALRISLGATILEDGAVVPILDVPALLTSPAR